MNHLVKRKDQGFIHDLDAFPMLLTTREKVLDFPSTYIVFAFPSVSTVLTSRWRSFTLLFFSEKETPIATHSRKKTVTIHRRPNQLNS